MDSIRSKQIREVLDEDKNINKRVFQTLFKSVGQMGDTLKQPSPLETKLSYDIEKYIIEMESILTDIQSELESKIIPQQKRLVENIDEGDIEPQPEEEIREEEREGKEPEEKEREEEIPAPLQRSSSEMAKEQQIKDQIDLLKQELTDYENTITGKPNGGQKNKIAKFNNDIIALEKKLKPVGSGRKRTKRLRGGIAYRGETRLNLLEIWNKFINFLDKIVRVRTLSQNDLLSIYDRLDDLLPLLQSIKQLNNDASSVGVKPIGEGVIDTILEKISTRNLSPISPTGDLPVYSSVYLKGIQSDYNTLKSLKGKYIDEQNYKKVKDDMTKYLVELKSNRTGDEKQMAQRQFEIKRVQGLLPKLEEQYNLSKKISQKLGIKSEQELDRLIADYRVRKSRRFEEPVKTSRQLLKGEGKFSSSTILKDYGDEVYKIYTSIPQLSYDELEDLYIDLNDKRKFATESDNSELFQKTNFLIQSILTDERSKDIQRILGNGKKLATDYRLKNTSYLMPYKDTENDFYAK